MEIIKEIILKNQNILKLCQGDSDLNPRFDDNLGTMICFHNKYDLGDLNDKYNRDDYSCWKDIEDIILVKEKPIVILPLYLYDHSGITISTEPFNCKWDSGQVGYIYITQKNIDLLGTSIKDDETWGEYKERLTKQIINEVKEYDYYIRGEVYSILIQNPEGCIIDSISGFLGDDWATNGMSDYLCTEDLDKL